jgi:RNA polymerase sigma-70 factor, ECF subfamily
VIEIGSPGINSPVTLVVSMAIAPAATEGSSATPSAERRARLQRLVDEQYRLVWRLLRRLGVPTAAIDDATQQVFLIVAERLDDIRAESERSFTFGTALRIAQTGRRRLMREQASDETDERACAWPAPDELAEQKRARELLDAILDELPLELRAVFVLFELEGFSSPEIATLVEAPLGTVASRLRRARDRFRELVEQRRAAPGAAR